MTDKNFLLVDGIDPGNTRTKVSYLDETGNIQSFSIPTVIAPADATGDPLRKESKEISSTDRLHVYIQSKAVSGTYHYVGDFARDKDDMKQPNGSSKSNSELHIVCQLTALAVAAAKMDKYNVDNIYSGGLPIEEFKVVKEDEFVEKMLGLHVIEFLDGVNRGKKVHLNIVGGHVNIEGATTSLALTNNIQDGNLVELPAAEVIDKEDHCVADLGAGTLDVALFQVDGLNGKSSTNYEIGTNKYIDAMIDEISEIPSFKKARQMLAEVGQEISSPYQNREQFLSQVIVPEVDKMLKDTKGKYEPKFVVSWLPLVMEEDVTPIVLKHMNDYYETVERQLTIFSLTKAQSSKNFFLVGGGVLFAYYYFRNIEFYQLPDKEVIKDSAFLTSRAYLINTYLEGLSVASE